MLEVDSTGLVCVTIRPPKEAEMATKPPSAPFQKHSPGGLTIDMLTSNSGDNQSKFIF